MSSPEERFKEWLVEFRRDLHMHPETGYEEVWTTAQIKAVLEELGLEVVEYEDLTGTVALLKGRPGQRVIGLRADIDALPIQELNETPYKSRHDGRMHACGHDANATIMLGVAKWLVESGLSREIQGQVKFIFQPAEEGGGGAKKMIERGALENPRVDWVVGAHMSPEIEIGGVGLYRAQSHASADQFELIIRGRGAHGGRPHQGRDPIVAGAHVVVALQSIVGRNLDPLEAGVVTVGRFSAGQTHNVIPQSAELRGTIRALNRPVREEIWRRVQGISQSIAEAFEVECDLKIREGYPPCYNDEQVVAFLEEVLNAVVGPEKVAHLNPTTGAEDFAYYALERPSAIMRLGSGNAEEGLTHPLHSPYFDIDEEVLWLGVRIFTEAVRRFLA